MVSRPPAPGPGGTAHGRIPATRASIASRRLIRFSRASPAVHSPVLDSHRARIGSHIRLWGLLRRIARERPRGAGFLPLLDFIGRLLDTSQLQLQVGLYRPEAIRAHA